MFLERLTLIGNGAMAKAIAQGLYSRYKIEVVGRDIEKLKLFRDSISSDIDIVTLGDSFDITDKSIIVCVKPYSLQSLSYKLEGKSKELYSILAGTTIDSISNSINSSHYIRVMPNLAAKYSKSMTTITGDDTIKSKSIDIFSSIGQTLWVSSEKELDIATAIAGSGPAFLSMVAEALADGGVNQGLKRDDAKRLVEGLFDGFSPLIQNSNPADIKDGVMSPAGTTAAGYSSLEKDGVRSAFINAIQSAYQRALDIGKI
jgi:pyrroline-5-carboxylate reductase